MIGALHLGDVAADLENACRAEDDSAIALSLEQTRKALAAVFAELATVLAKMTGGEEAGPDRGEAALKRAMVN
jgi:hypothetical protein